MSKVIRIPGKRNTVPIDYHLDECSYDPTDALNDIIDLKRFLPRLNPQDRKIMEMHFEGYTQEEIAGQFGIDQSNISRKIQKLLDAIA